MRSSSSVDRRGWSIPRRRVAQGAPGAAGQLRAPSALRRAAGSVLASARVAAGAAATAAGRDRPDEPLDVTLEHGALARFVQVAAPDRAARAGARPPARVDGARVVRPQPPDSPTGGRASAASSGSASSASRRRPRAADAGERVVLPKRGRRAGPRGGRRRARARRDRASNAPGPRRLGELGERSARRMPSGHSAVCGPRSSAAGPGGTAGAGGGCPRRSRVRRPRRSPAASSAPGRRGVLHEQVEVLPRPQRGACG